MKKYFIFGVLVLAFAGFTVSGFASPRYPAKHHHHPHGHHHHN